MPTSIVSQWTSVAAKQADMVESRSERLTWVPSSILERKRWLAVWEMPATLARDPAVCATPVRMKIIAGRMLKLSSDISISPMPRPARDQFRCKSNV
jgi:hypothetical protein